MEPDKTYPLHSDDASRSPASPNLPASEQENILEVPSKYNQAQQSASSKPAAVPWYLQPLTKTTNSPLTSSQTRPFIPRQPITPSKPNDKPDASVPLSNVPRVPQADGNRDLQLHAVSVDESPRPNLPVTPPAQASSTSPFRSAPTPSVPLQQWSRQSEALSSADRFQMPAQSKAPEYQQALSGASPKPFSQFGSQPTKQTGEASPSKPRKSRKIIGIALTILLIAGIGTGVYWFWRNASAPSTTIPPPAVANAEGKLYQAIENHLNTGKIHQVYEQTTVANQTSKVVIDVTSDFSDPRTPKSYIAYETKSGESDEVVNGSGELIALNGNEYYAKLTKPALFYNGADNVAPEENQWYVIKSDDVRSEVLMDPLGVRSSINSSLGEFPVGSFNDGIRQELMKYIKDQNVYKVISSEQAEVDGKMMTHYKLTIDTDKLSELNRKVFAAVGGNASEMPVEFAKSDKQNTEMWISNDATRIVKIKIERESASGDSGQVVKIATIAVIDYPDDISNIKKPESAKSPTW